MASVANVLRRRAIAAVAVAAPVGLAALLASATGCGGATEGAADGGRAPGASGAGSIRGNRYCEVLLAFFREEGIRAEVWGTQGLNDCPPEAWATVDPDAVRVETGATAVVLNGPRHWVLDRVSAELPPGSPRLFGTLEMQQLATVSIAPGAASAMPYVERTILRDSEFEFFAGAEIYELVAPDGAVYVMQSYARIAAPDLTASDLPGLATRLTLPAGWQYRVRTLDTALRVRAPGEATVVQDDLQNTYSKYTPGE